MEDLKFVYLICDGIGLILYALLYYCLYYTYQVNWLTSKATRIKIPRWTIPKFQKALLQYLIR